MAKIVIISQLSGSLVNFRGEMIKSFVHMGHEVIALGPDKGREEKITQLGAKFIWYPLQRTGLNPINDLYSFFYLSRLLRELKPDLVFSYAVKPIIYGSIAAKLAGVSGIYSMLTGLGYAFAGGNFKNRLLSKVVQSLYKRAIVFNKVMFFQNPDDLKLFRDLNILTDNTEAVLINGSGVELDKFYYSKPKNETVSFLLIARLMWEKGIKEYVEAARILKVKYPGIAVRLLGPIIRDNSAVTATQIDTWVAEGIIEYLGKTFDVRPFIEDASVYVLPSFYREGTPRSVLEAMSMGRPIITTDSPGCRETVEDGVNGFLIPTNDITALAAAMEKFILCPELISKMGQESRKIAENKYDVHKVNDIIIKAIRLERTDRIEGEKLK